MWIHFTIIYRFLSTFAAYRILFSVSGVYCTTVIASTVFVLLLLMLPTYDYAGDMTKAVNQSRIMRWIPGLARLCTRWDVAPVQNNGDKGRVEAWVEVKISSVFHTISKLWDKKEQSRAKHRLLENEQYRHWNWLTDTYNKHLFQKVSSFVFFLFALHAPYSW